MSCLYLADCSKGRRWRRAAVFTQECWRGWRSTLKKKKLKQSMNFCNDAVNVFSSQDRKSLNPGYLHCKRQRCSDVLTSVCWMAWEATLAVLWLSLASSTFSLMSGRSCFSSSNSVFSSLASPAPSAAAITSCNMALRRRRLTQRSP